MLVLSVYFLFSEEPILKAGHCSNRVAEQNWWMCLSFNNSVHTDVVEPVNLRVQQLQNTYYLFGKITQKL